MSRNIFYDNSTHVNYPNQIKVEERRAPTDESIRLMEEMHDKAIKNIIAKVKVEENLVNGECFAIEQPWNVNEIKLVFKFKINQQEFTLEKEISRSELLENGRIISDCNLKISNMAKSIMLWYALRKFTEVAFEQITGQTFPPNYLK